MNKECLKAMINLEINRCGNEERLVDLNYMWHIVDGQGSCKKGGFRKEEWTKLLDGIQEIIDNRTKNLKMFIEAKK